MPLGNLTSQFFANVYLNELDYFIKHRLKVKFYIRYVDDFIILHNSKEQLVLWKSKIDKFLKIKLKIELHPEKSKIIPLSKGIDFVGFRNFWYYKLLRKRNIRKILFKIEQYKGGETSKENILESFNGWSAYAKWANTYKVRRAVIRKIYKNDDSLNKKMTEEINFSDWEKLDIRVGKILKVEDIENADKLYKLEVDLGEGSIVNLVAGLKKYYGKKDLRGKRCVVLVNLEPKIMKGIKSEGMILAAVSEGEDIIRLIQPDEEIELGSRIR